MTLTRRWDYHINNLYKFTQFFLTQYRYIKKINHFKFEDIGIIIAIYNETRQQTVDDEGYSRSASCALNLISTFLSSESQK